MPPRRRHFSNSIFSKATLLVTPNMYVAGKRSSRSVGRRAPPTVTVQGLVFREYRVWKMVSRGLFLRPLITRPREDGENEGAEILDRATKSFAGDIRGWLPIVCHYYMVVNSRRWSFVTLQPVSRWIIGVLEHGIQVS